MAGPQLPVNFDPVFLGGGGSVGWGSLLSLIIKKCFSVSKLIFSILGAVALMAITWSSSGSAAGVFVVFL